MGENIVTALIVASVLGVAAIVWKRLTSPHEVSSTRKLPRGVSPDAVAWVGPDDPRPRVMTGPLRLAEWHFRNGPTFMVLIWIDKGK